MKRVASKMKLLKGFENEYKRRHDEIWPELKKLLKENNIEGYSFFLDEETKDLFMYFTIEDVTQLNEFFKKNYEKCWDFVKDIMETNEDNLPVCIPLKEVFYLP